MKTDANFYKKVLEEELARRTENNPRYSMRALARALGLEPGALSQFLSGKRVPSYRMAQKIFGGLDLAPDIQEAFLSSLAAKHKTRDLERVNPAFKKQKGKMPPKDLSLDLFRVIGDWYHYAILLLTNVEGFQPHARWIASQLSISEAEAKLAINRLLELELLKKENGTLVCFENHFTTADKHVTSGALKRHQKQVLEKALYSLENDPIDKRSHTSMTMAIDPKKINEAKLLVEEFTNRMSELLESGKRTQVYEFNVCLYPLSKTRDL